MQENNKQMTFPEFIDRVVDTVVKDRKKTILIFDRKHVAHNVEIEAVVTFVKEFDEEDQRRTVQVIASLDFAKIPLTEWLRFVAKAMVEKD